MEFILRPYQQDSFNRVVSYLESNDRCLVHGSTGFGKTVLFSKLLEHYSYLNALVLVHRTELRDQAERTLKHGKVMMVMTARRRNITLSDYDIVIIDESHRGEFREYLKKYKGKLIGFTATPYNTVNAGTYTEYGTEYYKRESLSDTFKYMVSGVSVADLVEMSFLANEVAITEVKTLEFDITAKTGDYDNDQQKKHFSSPNAVKSVRSAYDKYGLEGKKVLIFCNNISVADKVGELIPESRVVHSKASGRSEAVEWFRSTPGSVLINVDILTTGLDVPDIEGIIINRATASPVLWTQMVGRGGRMAEGKTNFTVIDLGGNVTRFGTWMNPIIDWETLFYNNDPKIKSKAKDPILKVCINKDCGMFIHPSVRECGFCGSSQIKYSEVNTDNLKVVQEFRIPTPSEVSRYINENNLNTRKANIFRVKILIDALRLSQSTRDEIKGHLTTGVLQYRAFNQFHDMVSIHHQFDVMKTTYGLSVRLAKKVYKLYGLEDDNSNWLRIRFLEYAYEDFVNDRYRQYFNNNIKGR